MSFYSTRISLLCNLGIWDKSVSKADQTPFLGSLWGPEGDIGKGIVGRRPLCMPPPRDLYIAVLNMVDEESVHAGVVFNASPEVDDGMKPSGP